MKRLLIPGLALAATAACWILRMLQKRRPLNPTPASEDQTNITTPGK